MRGPTLCRSSWVVRGASEAPPPPASRRRQRHVPIRHGIPERDAAERPQLLFGETGQKLNDVRLEISVRKIELSEDQESARATYTYTQSYSMPGLAQRKQSDSEIKQMIFKKVDKNVWKIVSGV